jgi:hypothetical protein
MPIFTSGTKTIFHQTSAPTGWTKETVNFNNHALRVITGASTTTGGSVDFTTAFSTTPYTFSTVAPYVTGDTTLTAAQIAPHQHTVTPSATRAFYGAPRPLSPVTPGLTTTITTNSTSSPPSGSDGLSHNHTVNILVDGNVFSNSPNSNLGVNYIDVIIATLN